MTWRVVRSPLGFSEYVFQRSPDKLELLKVITELNHHVTVSGRNTVVSHRHDFVVAPEEEFAVIRYIDNDWLGNNLRHLHIPCRGRHGYLHPLLLLLLLLNDDWPLHLLHLTLIFILWLRRLRLPLVRVRGTRRTLLLLLTRSLTTWRIRFCTGNFSVLFAHLIIIILHYMDPYIVVGAKKPRMVSLLKEYKTTGKCFSYRSWKLFVPQSTNQAPNHPYIH